jgi:hypothetical protein
MDCFENLPNSKESSSVRTEDKGLSSEFSKLELSENNNDDQNCNTNKFKSEDRRNDEKDLKIDSKAFLNRIYSQYSNISKMLVETVNQEDPLFSADLDRVSTWFTSEITHSQRLTTAFALLSHLSESDRDFIVSAISDAVVVSDPKTVNDVFNDSNCENDDHSINIEKVYEGSEKILSGSDKRSLVILQKNRMNSILLKPGQSLFSNIKTPLPTERVPPGFKTDLKKDYFSDPSIPLSEIDSPSQLESPQSELYFSNFPSWLKFFRLHKYENFLCPLYNSDPNTLLQSSSQESLQSAGVSTLGARRKFLKLFSQILSESQKAN